MKDGFEQEIETKQPRIETAVIGTNRELYEKLPIGMKKMATEKICIFYDNKTAEIIDFTEYDEEKKLKEIDETIEIINSSIIDSKNFKTLYSDSKAFEKVEKKAEKRLEGKDNSTLKKVGIAAGIIAGAAVLGTSCGAILDNINNEKNQLKDIPDMDGKDLRFYSENALETAQKDLVIKNITAWLQEKSAKENWMTTILTDEQMKELGITDPESIFGFTAEDAYSLALRFGHYTRDEYVTLTGGKEMDIVSIMDDAHSQSNGALSNIISYYICSDECDLNIETLINFNEKEIAKVNEIETMLREFKSLKKENKDSEAKAKMVEIKNWLVKYAHTIDYEQDNAKSYILRTFLPACSALSGMYQYTDKVELELYDTVDNVNTTKEITTALFDEITMRNLVLGYNDSDNVGAFDAEAYLQNHKISPSRYNLINTDVTRSIADQSVSDQLGKLEQANEYIANLRNDDLTAEAAYANKENNLVINLSGGRIGDQVAEQMNAYGNVITTYDELTYGTYEPELLLEMINNHLKENNVYPKNINYFRTAKLAEESIKEKDNNGITAGQKGDTVTTKKEENVNIDNVVVNKDDVVLDKNDKPTTMDDAKEEAREEAEKDTGIKDVTTPEAEKEAEEEAKEEALTYAQFLQGVYNATFNHVYGSSVVVDGFDTSNTYGLTYTDAWATDSDPMVVNKYNKAVKQANDYKEAQQHKEEITGGNEVIYDEYKEDKKDVVEKEETKEEVKPENTEKEDDGYSDVAPEGFSPVVDDIEAISNDVVTTPEVVTEPTIDEVVEEAPVTETEIEEGYSDEAPIGFSPVVDDTQVTNGEIVYFSEEDFINYLNTEEGNAWFESVTSSEVVEVNETGKTK